MKVKKPLLETIGREMDISVSGVENYDPDTPTLLVANHACLRDVFAIPAALPEACKVVLSARLAYKNSTPETAKRRTMIEDALSAIPLEVHGGKERLQIGLEMAKQALNDGWSTLIFPEGAYTGEAQVTKGRTGASRILFSAREAGKIRLLPVGITYDPWPTDLDAYLPQPEEISVVIGEPIDYEAALADYRNASDREAARRALRAPIDMAMRAIADSTGLPYINEAIKLRPRTTIILESGEEVAL